jgi:hypothetical protein
MPVASAGRLCGRHAFGFPKLSEVTKYVENADAFCPIAASAVPPVSLAVMLASFGSPLSDTCVDDPPHARRSADPQQANARTHRPRTTTIDRFRLSRSLPWLGRGILWSPD